MALNGKTLGQSIKSKIDSLGGSTNRDQIFEKIGEAIVEHIVASGQVTVIVTGGSSSGTHSGTIK